MKKIHALLAMYALSGVFDLPHDYHSSDNPPKRKPKPRNVIPPIPKGHKKFVIEGREIWALNYKNALKKFNK